jgi:hypothetical protein
MYEAAWAKAARGRRFRQYLKLMRFRAALAMRGPQTIGAGIAAADNDHALALGGNRFVGDGDARRALVLLREILHSEVNALEFATRHGQISRQLGAHRQPDRIKLLTKLLRGEILPNGHAALELDTLGSHLLQPSIDNPLFHFKVGNAVS